MANVTIFHRIIANAATVAGRVFGQIVSVIMLFLKTIFLNTAAHKFVKVALVSVLGAVRKIIIRFTIDNAS